MIDLRISTMRKEIRQPGVIPALICLACAVLTAAALLSAILP